MLLYFLFFVAAVGSINYNDCDKGTSKHMIPFVYKFVTRFGLQTYSRLMRGKTLGVRIAAFDSNGAVMLVKHSYAPGWILPGGGVERGEMLIAAAAREIREEAGIVADGSLAFHGIFSNEQVFPGDFVCCYVLRQFHRENWVPNHEITDARLFPIADLPNDITAGSQRRLNEILHGQAISEFW